MADPPGSRIAVVSWRIHPRARDLADTLTGTLFIPSPANESWPAPLRYLVQSALTVRFVRRRRPESVIFTNPPFVAGLLLLWLGRNDRLRVWSDSHSGAFNNPRWARWRWANRLVVRRCAGVIVTNERLAAEVAADGGRPFVVNDPLRDRRGERRRSNSEAPILVPFRYAFDEPVAELLSAAGSVPHVRLVLTGPAPAWVRRQAPPNCLVTGWLDDADYERALAEARGVVCLTTREDTMQRGAYEAVQRGLPMLLSGTAALRGFFGDAAAFVDDHQPLTLAAGLERLWSEAEMFRSRAERATATLVRRSRAEVGSLRAVLDDGSP
jgi:hypothetical protein